MATPDEVWAKLSKSTRRRLHLKYINTLQLAMNVDGYRPNRGGVGATESIYQKRAHKLEGLGLLERRTGGLYFITPLGRGVLRVAKVGVGHV